MTEVRLKDEQWRKVKNFLNENPKVYVGQEYGNWNSVYKRFDRWSDRGVWKEMFEHFAEDPDMESVTIDGSVVRAHACAAGAAHKKGGSPNSHLAIAEAGSAPNFT